MSMPKDALNRIAKWTGLAAIPLLLAVGTLIVASEGLDGQQGFSVGAANRFVMFDERSAANVDLNEASDSAPGQSFDPRAFHFEGPTSHEAPASFGTIDPVVRPALAPSFPVGSDECRQDSAGIGFTASDHHQGGTVPTGSLRQTTLNVPVPEQRVSPLAGYDSPTPLFEDPSAPILREAQPLDNQDLNALPSPADSASSFSFPGDGDTTEELPGQVEDDELAAEDAARHDPQIPPVGYQSASSAASEGEFTVTVPASQHDGAIDSQEIRSPVGRVEQVGSHPPSCIAADGWTMGDQVDGMPGVIEPRAATALPDAPTKGTATSLKSDLIDQHFQQSTPGEGGASPNEEWSRAPFEAANAIHPVGNEDPTSDAFPAEAASANYEVAQLFQTSQPPTAPSLEAASPTTAPAGTDRPAAAQPSAGNAPLPQVPTGVRSAEPEPPVPTPEPEGEVLGSEPYGLVSENGYFEEPAMPADCGMGCPRTWYARAEVLYVQRILERGISLTLDDFNGLDRFEFEPGGRITIGHIRDCLDGWEAVYTGFFDWTQRSLISGEDLNAEFTSEIFDLSTFENAQVQRQQYTSTFHSIELNRKWWGWDVLSTTFGIRYFHIGEDYRFDSLNVQEGLGVLGLDTKNNLLGAQLGMDLYQPIGRWTVAMHAKGGVYGNYVEANAGLINDGVQQFAIGDEKGQFAVEAEVGFFTKFQVLPRVNIQAGYEFWYIYGLATPPAQDRARLTRDLSIDTNDDLYYHGWSVGAEVVW